MTLFKNTSGKLTEVKEKSFKLERDIQKVFEANLLLITGLVLVKSEFTIKDKRIDTLAFDYESKSFVIIEYKRDRNISVIDQGFAYLGLMLENKADFIVEYIESMRQNLKRDEVEWSQTKVMFASTSFTDNQVQATNFKDLAIELWEITQYENDTIGIKHIKKSKSAASIKPLAQKDPVFKEVTDEIKIYTEEDHLEKANDEIKELYTRYKSAVLNMADNIEIKPQKLYIAFKKGKNITDVVILKNSLKIFINAFSGELDDPKKLARDVSKIGHWGNGHYEIIIENAANLEYIMSLIKQVIT